MKPLRDTTWQEVFAGWRKREAGNPGWIECATKLKGWPDWESWRSFTAGQFSAESRTWRYYQFSEPLREVPEMMLGPFTGWQSRVPLKNRATFKELLALPGQGDFWSGHAGVKTIMDGLPFATELIGLIRPDTNKIVCIDGHHRATAIALAQRQGRPIDFSGTPVTVALAELTSEECAPLLDAMLMRGTSRIA
jgi:hypothetical protein